MAGSNKEVIPNSSFEVSIDGINDTGFESVSAISQQRETAKTKSGTGQTQTTTSTKIYDDVTLTRSAVKGDSSIQRWFDEGGTRNFSVIYKNPEGTEEILRFDADNCSIKSYATSELNANGNDTVKETFTLSFDTGKWS